MAIRTGTPSGLLDSNRVHVVVLGINTNGYSIDGATVQLGQFREEAVGASFPVR